MKLDLRAPLAYVKTGGFPLARHEKDEFLLCFEIDPAQGGSIEPERGRLLGALLFCGIKPFPCPETGVSGFGEERERVILPEGEYLFVQRREAGSFRGKETGRGRGLRRKGASHRCQPPYVVPCGQESAGREKWLDMAVELQKDGLWEMFQLENRLYVRLLYEDGKRVTQLFRPLRG
ncbi:MAG: hypothetical protein LBU82_00240 [Treponema sp.]|nr:hypothetical protein [Treponema sp.]